MADKILIVDDDPAICKLLEKVMHSNELETTTVNCGMDALSILKNHTFDLILMDIMLGDMEGFEVIKRLRNQGISTPVMIVSGRNEDYDSLYGLSLGADDYITKPFTLALVKMHIEAVLKRAGKLRTMVEYNDLQADVNAQLLFYKGQHIPTTRKEFDLMVYFMEHSGIVLPRDTILNAVWEYDYTGDVRTIDTLVKQLRKKMGEGCNYIRTVYGVGYIFGEDIHEN